MFSVQNQDTVSLDTVCRLYEVGRQKLAEEGDDDDQVRHTQMKMVLSHSAKLHFYFSLFGC